MPSTFLKNMRERRQSNLTTELTKEKVVNKNDEKPYNVEPKPMTSNNLPTMTKEERREYYRKQKEAKKLPDAPKFPQSTEVEEVIIAEVIPALIETQEEPVVDQVSEVVKEEE